MPRALLILFLMGAQLVSWNASPLFLCLDSDGAVCVDLGPASCVCCRHHHDAETAWNATGESPTSDHSEPACIDAPPCDCTHVQITVAWTAVTVSRQESRSLDRPAVSAILADCAQNGIGSVSPAGRLLIDPACEFSSGIAGRSAVLRC
ncbi:MAG TPA: hypothetical protein VHX68_07920 [Planctomycetaceae bacterium]|jgi:hypothetical protein|nr:hypothetical protein [Planctomycetaceae bacterium]